MSENSPVLKLLLEDIKFNMDKQIEAARIELEETRKLNNELKSRFGNEPDDWSEYEVMTEECAAQRLYRRRTKTMSEQLDDIAAEG